MDTYMPNERQVLQVCKRKYDGCYSPDTSRRIIASPPSQCGQEAGLRRDGCERGSCRDSSRYLRHCDHARSKDTKKD